MKKLSLLLFMLMATVALWAQRAVTGTVTDADGEALIGANIIVKGQSTVGTVTDIDGKYTLNVPDGYDVILISYTGYATQEVTLGATNVVDIVMQEGVVLDELVVTALGISREEKSLGYAVQELEGEDLDNSRETNLVNSLQGRVAGVQIQGSPSSIGGTSRITIRGSSSFLGNNQPLFVIDGIPVDNSSFATDRQARGFNSVSREKGDTYDYGNMAQDIDPANIESMTVLKGAAATALYGQRGANGVIMITTKKGAGDKGFGIEVNSSVAFDRVSNLIPHQQEYGGGSINPDTESGFNEVIIDGTTYLYPSYSKDGSWGPKYNNQSVRHWDSWDPQAANFGETRPWEAPANGYESFFETGVTLQNSVALTGANDKGSFRLGYTNTDQSGTFPNARLDRNAFNFGAEYKLHPRVTAEFSANYVRTRAENRNITGYNNGNAMQAFTQWWQTQLDVERLKNNATLVDGTQYTWNSQGPQIDADNNLLFFDHSPNFFDNPYWVRDNFLQEDTRNRIYGNAKLTFNLMEGLDLMGRVGTDFYDLFAREGIPNTSVETGSYAETTRRFSETNMEARLTYNKSFGAISVTAHLGGNNMKQNVQRLLSLSSGGLALDDFFSLDNSAGPVVNRPFRHEYSVRSGYALAVLGFNNWLYLDLSGRKDWSSGFRKELNNYEYGAAALSAVLTDIPSLQNLGPISFAKVRLSYAVAGNDNFATENFSTPYRLWDVYQAGDTPINGSPQYEVPIRKNNPDLEPERTKEYEFGIDLRFWNNRLGIDAAYFDRTSINQIFPVDISASTGFDSRWVNAGEMRNYGYEIQLTANPVRTRDFSWDLGVNLYRQNNEVIELLSDKDDPDNVVESINFGGTWAADLRITEGESYMGLYGNDYVREHYEEDGEGNIIRNEGEPTIDEDGNYVFTNERVYLGSVLADWTGGFSTAFNYKGVSLSALFDFQVGGIIHSTSLQWSKYSGMHPETIEYNGVSDVRETGLILPGVKADGSQNDIAIDPQTYYQTYWNRAAPNVYDASFLKLREIRLGYTIPNSVFGNSSLRDVNVSLFGRNLAILAADLPYLDPQIVTGGGNVQGLENAQVPSTRSFGVNISFKL